MMMKKIIIMAMMIATGISAMAQNKVEATISTDVVSQYIWRGQDLGNVSLQPTLGVSYKGFSLSAWGNVGLSEPADTKELDLTASYSIGGFNIGITDYWLNEGLDPRNRYFKYQAHETNHVFEANIGYDFGFASLQAYTNFAGNDGLSKHGHRAYSSYVEVAAPFHLIGVDWKATAGAVPYATTSYGTTGFAVTNLSLSVSKAIAITQKFSVPVFASVISNPRTQKAYLVFGFTLQP